MKIIKIEDGLSIQGTDASRYLDSDEVFRKAINFNRHLPKEREFQTGEGIRTDKDDTAYSIDELVMLLNYIRDENKQLKQENEELRMSPRVDANEIESLVYENKELKDRIKDLNYTIRSLKYEIKYVSTYKKLQQELFELKQKEGDLE